MVFTQKGGVVDLGILCQDFQRRVFVGKHESYGIKMGFDDAFHDGGALANIRSCRRQTRQWEQQLVGVIQHLVESQGHGSEAGRRLQQDRLDDSGLERGQPARVGNQHLNDAHVLVGHEPVFFQNDARGEIRPAAELADADPLAAELFDVGDFFGREQREIKVIPGKRVFRNLRAKRKG